MTVQILTLNTENFTEQVLESVEPVLVDFYADWCGPCKTMAPVITELADEFAGQAKVAKLDVDKNPEVANHYGIRSIPTMMLFKGGEVLEMVQGAVPRPRLETMITRHVV